MKLLHSTIISIAAFGAAAVATHGAVTDTHRVAVSSTTKAFKKNLAVQGDVAGAIAQTQNLVTALSNNDWDQLQVDRNLLRLPDQDFSQNASMRGPNDPSFCVPGDSLYHNVAAFCTLYCHFDNGHSNTSGFFIVGYKDGHIEQVPVANIRLLPRTDEVGVCNYVWPGISGYSDRLTLLGDNPSLNSNYPAKINP